MLASEGVLILESVKRQRNLFLIVLLVSIASNLLLSLKIFSQNQRIIMVPGIAQEMKVEVDKVSKSYLEESALQYLSMLLDLSPSTLEHKKEIVLRNVSGSSKSGIEGLRRYLNSAEYEYKKLDLRTYFTPRRLEISEKEMAVVATGTLSRIFGKSGYDSSEESYLIRFEVLGGRIKIKEFVHIVEEKNK